MALFESKEVQFYVRSWDLLLNTQIANRLQVR